MCYGRWCLDGADARVTCWVEWRPPVLLLCALEAVGLPPHTQCRHHHRHGLGRNKTFFWVDWSTVISSHQVKILKTIRYLLSVKWMSSGQIPSINLKLIETLKMLWNQILVWDGLFYLLTVGFIRSDKVSKYHMAPRVSCLLSVSRDPSFYNNIFLSSDDLFSWNK